MRRVVGLVSIAALAAALMPAHASAAFLPASASEKTSLASRDLRPELIQAIFGERDDARASLAAAYGDRRSESPLRELVLQPRTVRSAIPEFAGEVAYGVTFAVPDVQSFGSDPAGTNDALAQAIRARLLEAPPNYAPASVHPGDPPVVAATRPPVPTTSLFDSGVAVTVGSYQPIAPGPDGSPEPGSQAFGPLARGSDGLAEARALAIGATSTLPGSVGSTVVVPEALHVGPVALEGRVEGSDARTPELALNDSAYGAGANFDVRAGRRNLNVDLSSSYERLTRNDATAFSAGASTWELPGADAPLAIPNYADLSKIAVGANLAFPVMRGLTLNVNYDAQRLLGGYGLPGLVNLDATNNSYGAGMTLALPRYSSTLSISAHQSHYQDNILPANSQTQTTENVNLTVKF